MVIQNESFLICYEGNEILEHVYKLHIFWEPRVRTLDHQWWHQAFDLNWYIKEHDHRNIKIEIQWSVYRLLIAKSLEALPFVSSHLANEKPLLRAMPFQLRVRKNQR